MKIIFIILSFCFIKFVCGSDKGWKKTFLQANYEGKIRRKFHDPNRGMLDVIQIEGDEDVYIILNNKIFYIIQNGDYIIKKRGTLKHILIKNNDTICFYPIF